MNNNQKQKWILPVLLLLLISNLITLVYLWLPPKPPKVLQGGAGFDLMVKELSMTASQQATYLHLREEHQATVRPLREQMKNAKDALFALLANDTVSTIIVNAAAAKAAAIQQQLDMASYQHFKKLRAICTPTQQQKFDTIIQDVIRQMAPQGGGRGVPPPGGPGGRRPGGPPPDSMGFHPDGPPPNNEPPPRQ